MAARSSAWCRVDRARPVDAGATTFSGRNLPIPTPAPRPRAGGRLQGRWEMKFAGIAVVLALLASGWPAAAQVRIPEPIRPPQVMVPPPPPALPTIQPAPAVPAC